MASSEAPPAQAAAGRQLAACCGAHIIQDGLVALQFVLLPILAQIFGLSYAQVGLLRGLSNTAMAALELPSGILAERFGERRLLTIGLLGAGFGYVCVALAPGFAWIAVAFVLTGAGAAFQHSLASSMIVRAFDDRARRRALGTYNSSGDAGKLAFTGTFSAGLGAGLAWNTVVVALALVAGAFGLWIWLALRGTDPTVARRESASGQTGDSAPAGTSVAERWGIRRPRRFAMLGALVFLDSTVQAVFLTFLAFLLLEKGVSEGLAAGAVVIALAGGMVGKFASGFLAARLGDRNAFVLLQLLTVLGIGAAVLMPAGWLLFALPAIGLAVQGSSTVTYGSVADFVDSGRQARGYALIYTLATASSVTGPFAFGLLADLVNLDAAMWGLCGLTGVTIALSAILARPAHAVASA